MGLTRVPFKAIVALCLVLATAQLARAQAGLLVFVPNTNTGNVQVFRTNADGSLTVVATLAVGTSPRAVAVRADQAFAYIANAGSNTVSVIDAKTPAVTQTIGAGAIPQSLALNPANTRLYAGNLGSNTVTVYSVSAANGQLTSVATLSGNGLNQPYALAVTPDGNRLYVANLGGGSVSVFNTQTNTAVTTIPVGTSPVGIAMDSTGARAYVANSGSQTVSVIDLASNTVVASPTTPGDPDSITITPDGAFYYVTNDTPKTIAQFSAATDTEIAPPVSVSGAALLGLDVTPAGGFLYVTNQDTDAIDIFSIGSDGALTSVTTQSVGLGNSNPSGLRLCRYGNQLLQSGLTFIANTAAALNCTGGTATFTGGRLTVNNPGLSFGQTFNFNSASLINTNGNNATIAGTLTGGGGFTKEGVGTLILSGASSTPGPITINNGTLRVSGDLDAASTVTVLSGKILEGTGTIAGTVTGAGTIQPGSPGNTAGKLTVGTYAPSAGEVLAININGTTAVTQYDVLGVTGTVSLGSASGLLVTLGFTPVQGQSFTVVDNQGASPIDGTFSGLPEGASFTVNSTTFFISYRGGDGNDVTLYVVPVAPVLGLAASPGGPVGTVLFDTVTMSGGASPTGTLTFVLYGPNDAACSPSTAFVATRTVNGNGSYQTPGYTATAPGVYRWVVSYSGDDNNTGIVTACGDPAQTVTIAGKSDQTISFAPLSNRTMGDPPFTISATASSGLAVTFSSLTPGVCTVSGSTVTLVAAGTCTIAADQGGDATYNPAPQVTRSFTVAAGCSSVSLTPAQLPFGVVGLTYSQTFTLTGGTGTVTFSQSGSLPGGLTFTNDVLSGKPTTRGSFPITVTGTDANNCQASRTYDFAISAERRLLAGSGTGGGGAARAFNLSGATPVMTTNSGSGFNGGTSVAEADVDGNGFVDVITGAGPGGTAGPTVTVFDGFSGTPKLAFFAFPSTFTGGVEVAAGDINGDGQPEILVAQGCSSAASAVVRAFNGSTGAMVREYAVSPSLAGCGLHVAAGDVNDDGIADIIVGSAGLGPSYVRVIDGSTGALIREFFPYTTGYTGGVYVAAGDVNGDGFADIVTGAGPGGTPHVRVFDGTSGNQIAGALGSFLAYPSGFSGGVRVAAGDLNGDGKAEVITGAGPGGTPHVRVFDGATTSELIGFLAFDPSSSGGVFVAAPVLSARMAVDIAGARTSGTEVRFAGWALHEIAADTNGNDAIHVWAYPVGGGSPVFVGAAPARFARPDVAAFFGGEFRNSGFDFTGTLAAGTYDLVIYARNTKTLKFDQVRVFRVTVQ